MFQSTPTREPVTLVEQARQYKHRRRLLVAMVVLLAALAIFLVRDREIWFGSDETPEAQDSWTGPTQASPSASEQVSPVAATTNDQVAAKTAPGKAATTRATLPPVEVEVIAGATHHTVHSSNSETLAKTASGPLTAAAQRVRMSAEDTQALEQPAVASYPLLGRQMKVQGSVLMQALIGADGVIEELHVISGPAILAVAARQAVQNWRFKPYLQNGQPVETQARVTVNFTIKVTDDVARNHLSSTSSNGF